MFAEDAIMPVGTAKAEMFTVGQMAPPFRYHDKVRTGTVETVGDGWVRLELPEQHPEHLTKFQTFRFEKIQLL